MIWRQLNPRYRRLLRSGQRGRAVVVNAEQERLRDAEGADSTGIFGWTVTIRVKFADGSTSDFDRYVEARHAGGISAGMVLPVRYDPSKRSRVEIDVDALDAERAARSAHAEAATEAAVQHAEDRIEPLDSFPTQPGS